MARAQMTIFAPSSKQATQELMDIAQEVGQEGGVTVISVLPQGKHNWLVSYSAPERTIRLMEEWVS